MNYSVLMPIYYEEKPECLKSAMESIFNQTKRTDDFVLVCDGPLTKELEDVIEEEKREHNDILHIIRLIESKGVGAALNAGLLKCKNEWVGRMDSDDISLPERFEKQIELIENNHDISICSASIREFNISNSKKIRSVPLSHEDIIRFSKKRCPFNHPVIMYKKSAVIEAGGYTELNDKFEDYRLWIEMLRNGAIAANHPEVLLKMRTSDDMFLRRGGFKYANSMFCFRFWMVKIGWSNIFIFIVTAIPHFIVCILPNRLRKWFYNFLRSK